MTWVNVLNILCELAFDHVHWNKHRYFIFFSYSLKKLEKFRACEQAAHMRVKMCWLYTESDCPVNLRPHFFPYLFNLCIFKKIGDGFIKETISCQQAWDLV